MHQGDGGNSIAMGATRVGSEVRLVQNVKEGDAQSFELLYSQQHRSIYALALRLLCDPAAAEDVVQEVFISIWRGIRGFRGESSILTWMHTITVRTAMRRWHRRPEMQLDEATILRYEYTAARTFPDTKLRLERAIATLPAGARTVLLLHDVYGYTHSEIGVLLGIAIGTVKAQLHRARNLMKQELR
jgi:RNA polymerase sigma-70 factor (ECF subfamily)